MLGKKPTTKTGLGLLALMALVVFGPGVLTTADEPAETTDAAPTTNTAPATHTVPATDGMSPHGALGMIVVIDEESGKMRAATPYELEEMTSQHEQYWQDGSDLETAKGPGNSVILKLDSRFHKYTVAGVPDVGQGKVQHDVVLMPSKSLETDPAEEPVDGEEPTDEVDS